MQYLSKLLKEWRSKLQIPQEEAAILIGVRIQTYRNWELGLFRPSSKNLIKIEDTTGLKIDIRKLAEE